MVEGILIIELSSSCITLFTVQFSLHLIPPPPPPSPCCKKSSVQSVQSGASIEVQCKEIIKVSNNAKYRMKDLSRSRNLELEVTCSYWGEFWVSYRI